MSYRLQTLKIPASGFSVMSQAQYIQVTTKATELLKQGRTRVQADISDLEPSEVRALLASLRITDERVYVLWPTDQVGIVLTFDQFTQYYDDLWYPARDDIWVTSNELNCLLEISHEEILTVIDRV